MPHYMASGSSLFCQSTRLWVSSTQRAIGTGYQKHNTDQTHCFIIYKEMKYRKILIKYNLYLKKLYCTAVKI